MVLTGRTEKSPEQRVTAGALRTTTEPLLIVPDSTQPPRPRQQNINPHLLLLRLVNPSRIEGLSIGKSTTRTVHRSSETGRFVTKRYAETHPRTAERERVKVPPPSPKPKK